MTSLYDKICSYDNLFLAYKKARRGKGKKWYVIKFEENLERNLIELEKDLRYGLYVPKPMKTFVISDPKTRTISASNFRDRIVHHAICNVIEPIFEKSFINDSYASRKGKGTHAAVKRFDEFKRKISRNGRLAKKSRYNNTVVGYVLKADIKHYFDTVDHEILLSVVSKRIKDEFVLCLIRAVLKNHSGKKHGKGMPIGNLTSQLFANVYLNELDYFVKHRLRAKYYIRYLDDFIIFHRDKGKLSKWANQINGFCQKSLKLELHPDKSKIYPLRNGVNFLGYRIFYHYKLPKKTNIDRFRRKMRNFASLYEDGLVNKGDIAKRTNGWYAYAMHANTYRLRKRLEKDIQKSVMRVDSIKAA